MPENVFINLLDNPVHQGGHVTRLTASLTRQNNDLVVLWEDNGICIPEDEKARDSNGLWEKYRPRHLPCTGILSLTGISITECGIPGEGVRFEIFVPEGRWHVEEPDSAGLESVT